ncbi:hypothetical protein D3C79_1032270 [compost metagenome]
MPYCWTTAPLSRSLITTSRYSGSALICASVNGITASFPAANALVWSPACTEAASLDWENAKSPRACGPLSVKLTSCR